VKYEELKKKAKSDPNYTMRELHALALRRHRDRTYDGLRQSLGALLGILDACDKIEFKGQLAGLGLLFSKAEDEARAALKAAEEVKE
jgi:hypothetical protein